MFNLGAAQTLSRKVRPLRLGDLPALPICLLSVTHAHQNLCRQPHQRAPPPPNASYLCVIRYLHHQVAHLSPPYLTSSPCLNVQHSSPRKSFLSGHATTFPTQAPRMSHTCHHSPDQPMFWKYIHLSGYTTSCLKEGQLPRLAKSMAVKSMQ